MKKIHYNKLVRDRIPAAIQAQGATYKIKKLGMKQFRLELLKKIGEEASSLPKFKTKPEIVSELADIVDVLTALKKEFKINEREIRQAQKLALASKGGFQKQTFLYWTEFHGYKTNERRYVGRRKVSKD